MTDTTKKDSSVGRARGHSMLSPLKAMNQEQGVIGEPPRGSHPGISFARLRGNQDVGRAGPTASVGRPSLITAKGRIASESRVSALTMAIQAAGIGEYTGPSPIAVTPLVQIPDADAAPSLSADSGSEPEQEIPIETAEELEEDYWRNPDWRKWCSGQPPKESFLRSARADFPPRFRMSRRNTLADRPELDVLLAATKVEYKGHYFLPLTAQTIHRLDPFFKGAKPLADMKLFECIILNHEINGVHADHVVEAMERIGEHCKHLLVMSPVQTSELGNVFAREVGVVSSGNDWDSILACFPNLKCLAFVHPVGESIALSRNTFSSLQQAVANRQAGQEDLTGVSFGGPLALLT